MKREKVKIRVNSEVEARKVFAFLASVGEKVNTSTKFSTDYNTFHYYSETDISQKENVLNAWCLSNKKLNDHDAITINTLVLEFDKGNPFLSEQINVAIQISTFLDFDFYVRYNNFYSRNSHRKNKALWESICENPDYSYNISSIYFGITDGQSFGQNLGHASKSYWESINVKCITFGEYKLKINE